MKEGVGKKERDIYAVVGGKDLSLEEVDEIIRLDALSFDACYRVTAGDDYALFRANRENGIVIKEKATGRIVGYSMLLPVTHETYEMIRRGEFVDTELTPEMVVKYDRPGIYELYFASVAVHPDHRNAQMIILMLDAMVQSFIDLTDRGIYIDRMLADVVSREGVKFCRLFGLTEVCPTNHGSTLYEVSGLPPMLRVTTATTQRLYDLYRAKFADEYGDEADHLGERVLNVLDDDER